MEFMFERSMPATGTAVAIVIGPPLMARYPRQKNQKNGGDTVKSMQTACRAGVLH
jgi:hypothetical protein